MTDLKIIEEKKNPLFNRREIKVETEARITPSYTEAEKLIAEKFSTKLENIKVKNVLGKFGSKKFNIIANVYDSPKDKDSTEVKTKQEIKAEKKAISERQEKANIARAAATVEENKPEEPKAEEKPAEAPAEKESNKEKTPVEKKNV